MNLETFSYLWSDTPDWHIKMKEVFEKEVNKDDDLKRLRDWVEQNIWGFGERSFYYMWKLIIDEMPREFNFLEIGVFRGQVLALVKMLAGKQRKIPDVVGISPLSNKGGYWDSDYKEDVKRIHDKYALGNDYLIYKKESNDPETVKAINEYHSPFDLVYIDGGHEYETVLEDMKNYLPALKIGGYLVMDDCADRFDLPDGYFRGHKEVSKAVDEVLPPGTENSNYEHLFNIIHNRIWRKLK